MSLLIILVTLLRAMAGLTYRFFGSLALLVFVALVKGAERDREKEDGRKIQIFGPKGRGGQFMGRVLDRAKMTKKRDNGRDKRKTKLIKRRLSSTKGGRLALEKKNKGNTEMGIARRKNKKAKKKVRKLRKTSERGRKKSNAIKKRKRKTKLKKKKENMKRECLSTTCVDNAVKIMRLLKDRLSFYETKFKRISKKSQIGLSKSGKNSVFQPALVRLIAAGGGNRSALVCAGNSSNSGSQQMSNLTKVLRQCDVNVKAACDPSGFPLPNMTEVNRCLDKGEVINNLSGNCSKLSGSEACSCWEGSKETESAVEVFKSCDLTPSTKAVTKALNKCKEVFGKCRKYEDAVADIINLCNQRPATMRKRLKNLSQNKEAVEEGMARIADLTTTRFQRLSRRRRSVTSGSEFISTCQEVVLLVGQNPVSNTIYTLSITLVNSANVVFTSEDLAKLSSVEASLSSSIDVLSKEIATSAAGLTSKF